MLIIIIYFLEMIFSLELGKIIGETDKTNLTLLYLLINTIILIFIFKVKAKDKTMFMIFVMALIIRLVALFIDKNFTTLPFNTDDAQMFHGLASDLADNIALINNEKYDYGGIYTRFLGVIYYSFGKSMIWGQFTNILLVILAGLKLLDICEMLDIKYKYAKIGILVYLFAPIPFLTGIALIREALIYYCIMLATYYFFKALKKNRIYIVLSILYIYIASLCHEGVILLAFMCIYGVIFYRRKNNKLYTGVFNWGFLITCVIIAYLIIDKDPSKFLYTVNLDTGGGSAYLQGIKIETAMEFMLFSPIKAIYLIFSPMIWKVRGAVDIMALCLDTGIFVYTAILVLKNYKSLDAFSIMLLIGIVSLSLIFGAGTLNTGTAIRHRNKFVVLFLILSMIIKTSTDKEVEADVSL